MDFEAIDAEVDARDQQLDDARLLGREQLVPDRIQRIERLADVSLGQAVDLGSCCAPRGDDDLGRPKHAAQLVDDGCLDLGCRDMAHWACARPEEDWEKAKLREQGEIVR